MAPACAGLVRAVAPDVDLYSVRLFDSSLIVDGKVLIAALKWAIDMEMDVVNMSLGTTEICYRDELQVLCRQAVDAGIVLVAAGHNEGIESYPSSLSEVVGVGAGRVYGRYDYIYIPGAPLECLARGSKQRLCWLNGREVMLGGTSFAAPRISGLIALIKEEFPEANLDLVRQILHKSAVQLAAKQNAASATQVGVGKTLRAELKAATTNPDWIVRAVLYPYNKEMHGLIRLSDQLSFDVVGVVDPPGKGLVGRDAGEAIGAPLANVEAIYDHCNPAPADRLSNCPIINRVVVCVMLTGLSLKRQGNR